MARSGRQMKPRRSTDLDAGKTYDQSQYARKTLISSEITMTKGIADLDGVGHFRAGIVCGNSSTMAERPSAPYNGGRMAAQMRRESPAKVAEIPPQGRKKHREMTAQSARNG